MSEARTDGPGLQERDRLAGDGQLLIGGEDRDHHGGHAYISAENRFYSSAACRNKNRFCQNKNGSDGRFLLEISRTFSFAPACR